MIKGPLSGPFFLHLSPQLGDILILILIFIPILFISQFSVHFKLLIITIYLSSLLSPPQGHHLFPIALYLATN